MGFNLRYFFIAAETWLFLALGACAAQQIITSNCPSLKTWTPIEQLTITDEERMLKPDSIFIPVLEDYIRMRDEARACK